MALRLERSKSWVLQKAWELARQDIKKLHSPYPEDLVTRFKNISRRYSQATQGMSEKEVNKLAVDAVRKIRKKRNRTSSAY